MKIINSILAIFLFALTNVLMQGNRINRRIAHLESEHNRLLQDQNVELAVRTAALSEISRSIDQVGEYPIPQRN